MEAAARAAAVLLLFLVAGQGALAGLVISTDNSDLCNSNMKDCRWAHHKQPQSLGSSSSSCCCLWCPPTSVMPDSSPPSDEELTPLPAAPAPASPATANGVRRHRTLCSCAAVEARSASHRATASASHPLQLAWSQTEVSGPAQTCVVTVLARGPGRLSNSCHGSQHSLFATSGDAQPPLPAEWLQPPGGLLDGAAEWRLLTSPPTDTQCLPPFHAPVLMQAPRGRWCSGQALTPARATPGCMTVPST